MVVRFGSAMAVIDEYIIVGGFDKTRQTYTWTVYMYDTAFGGGVPVPGICRRDRLDGCAIDADRRLRHVLAIPVAGLASEIER